MYFPYLSRNAGRARGLGVEAEEGRERRYSEMRDCGDWHGSLLNQVLPVSRRAVGKIKEKPVEGAQPQQEIGRGRWSVRAVARVTS